MSLKDDLIAAKKLIGTPEKWRQDGYFGFGTDRRCIMGAVCEVTPEIGDSFRSLRQALAAQLPENRRPLVVFNDDPATTHADVMALFDRAIEAAGA